MLYKNKICLLPPAQHLLDPNGPSTHPDAVGVVRSKDIVHVILLSFVAADPVKMWSLCSDVGVTAGLPDI
jgi:hypothetical protein